MDSIYHKPTELLLQGNVAENWRKFKQRFTLFLEASEKTSKPGKLKVAILLNLIGEEALEVFNTFKLSADEAKNLDIVLKRFDEFCEPKRNIVFERFKFFSTNQAENESVDNFVTELKRLANSCEFADQLDGLIRDRIVFGIRNKSLQERLLRECELTLAKAIEMCKADEISKIQLKAMQQSQNVSVIKNKERKDKFKKKEYTESIMKKCQRCGNTHKVKQCPAWGKKCMKCHKMNHFAKQCKNTVRSIDEEEKEETMWGIKEAKKINSIEWKKSILVNGKNISFRLDLGAAVNVLPYSCMRGMENVKIKPTGRKLTSYTGHEIKIKGIVKFECKTRTNKENLEFFVAEGGYQPVLGIEALEKLRLVQVCDAIIQNADKQNTASEILEKYEDVFQGVGKLPIEHRISIKEGTKPIIAGSRKIPHSLREKVKEELHSMEKRDIIQKIEEPTEWVHPIVVVQKPSGGVRICMDPRELNKSIKREHYVIPTAEAIFGELNGATVFSVLDASTAFWQIPLDDESARLCTIATPFGRYMFKRLPYGLNSAPEVFQRSINDIITGLQGVTCYMDDLLIYGSDIVDHNIKLSAVMERLRKHNVKLSKNKLQLAVDKVNYQGHVISKKGVEVQQSKIEAIKKLKQPQNKAELQRFLGMITYLAKFIPNLSDKTAKLRRLISNKTEWQWGPEEQECYESLKTLVSNAPVLSFFDPNKSIHISTDASQYGVGTVIMQEGHPIEYASFSLNETQKRYAQIEKELLALVLGCERFHYYLWGTDFEAETDHKPLLSIIKKPLEKLSPRLQRMMLRLLRYRITLKFTPGKNMFIADHLSRDPMKQEVETSYLEGQAGSVHMLLCTTEDKIQRLQRETRKDPVLVQLAHYVQQGWPKYKSEVPEEVRNYWLFQEEIHESEDIMYRGDRVIIPTDLRKEILQVVHASHQGIVAGKNKARMTFYWPGMMANIEEEVTNCRTCQEYSRKNPQEMRIPHEIPTLPWEKIAIDFMTVEGGDYLLAVDYHSKFVEVRKLINKKEAETVGKLKSIFRTHGIPGELISDNGPPFNSAGFQKFSQEYEFKHQTSSPKYPKSNGQVERAIETAKGLIIKAMKSGRDPNIALMEFNNTPKADLPAPSRLLMGRSIKTISTYTKKELQPLFDTEASYKQLVKNQQKYAGKPDRILEPLEIGQSIMMQEDHRKWTPATVINKHEAPRSYVVKLTDGREFRRNRVHLRNRKFQVSETDIHSERKPNSLQEHIQETDTTGKEGLDTFIMDKKEQINGDKPRETAKQKDKEQAIMTRSGRIVKTPARYKD